MAGHELGKRSGRDAIAPLTVVEVVHPIEVGGAGEVTAEIESRVFVGFDEANVGIIEAFRDPLGGNEGIGVGVAALVDFAHGSSLTFSLRAYDSNFSRGW